MSVNNDLRSVLDAAFQGLQRGEYLKSDLTTHTKLGALFFLRRVCLWLTAPVNRFTSLKYDSFASYRKLAVTQSLFARCQANPAELKNQATLDRAIEIIDLLNRKNANQAVSDFKDTIRALAPKDAPNENKKDAAPAADAAPKSASQSATQPATPSTTPATSSTAATAPAKPAAPQAKATAAPAAATAAPTAPAAQPPTAAAPAAKAAATITAAVSSPVTKSATQPATQPAAQSATVPPALASTALPKPDAVDTAAKASQTANAALKPAATAAAAPAATTAATTTSQAAATTAAAASKPAASKSAAVAQAPVQANTPTAPAAAATPAVAPTPAAPRFSAETLAKASAAVSGSERNISYDFLTKIQDEAAGSYLLSNSGIMDAMGVLLLGQDAAYVETRLALSPDNREAHLEALKARREALRDQGVQVATAFIASYPKTLKAEFKNALESNGYLAPEHATNNSARAKSCRFFEEKVGMKELLERENYGGQSTLPCDVVTATAVRPTLAVAQKVEGQKFTFMDGGSAKVDAYRIANVKVLETDHFKMFELTYEGQKGQTKPLKKVVLMLNEGVRHPEKFYETISADKLNAWLKDLREGKKVQTQDVVMPLVNVSRDLNSLQEATVALEFKTQKRGGKIVSQIPQVNGRDINSILQFVQFTEKAQEKAVGADASQAAKATLEVNRHFHYFVMNADNEVVLQGRVDDESALGIASAT